jgi:glycerol uptake facilitator protein
MEEKANWFGRYVGEAIGVWAIIFFGDGLLHVAILHNQVPGLWDASIGWGLAVALAVWLGGSASGAHYNPGVTLALAWRRGFPWSQVVPYIIAQILGGFVGAATLGVMYSTTISNFIAANGIVKTEPSGLLTALMYSPYTPHPAMYGLVDAATVAEANRMAAQWVPWWLGGIAEFVVTGCLMAGILNFLDDNQTFKPGTLFPLVLGLLVAGLVFTEAPLTMISMNAARDLGPRIWLLVNGYGRWAFPGLQGGGSTLATTVFPALGALFGAWFHDTVVSPHMGKAP